jgi:hypothetical protein
VDRQWWVRLPLEEEKDKGEKKEKNDKGKGKKSLNYTSYSIFFLLLKYSSRILVLVFSEKLRIHVSNTYRIGYPYPCRLGFDTTF